MFRPQVQIMYYAGYRVLPEAPLREDWVQVIRPMDNFGKLWQYKFWQGVYCQFYFHQPPAAMDGVPAPISMLVDPSVNPEAIALVSMMILTMMTLIKMVVLMMMKLRKCYFI